MKEQLINESYNCLIALYSRVLNQAKQMNNKEDIIELLDNFIKQVTTYNEAMKETTIKLHNKPNLATEQLKNQQTHLLLLHRSNRELVERYMKRQDPPVNTSDETSQSLPNNVIS